MSLKLLCLTVTILSLMGCSESENDHIYNQQRRNSSAMENSQRSGVDTARETVAKAKAFIVQLLVNSEASVFEQFPEGFTQETLIQIVQTLSFSGDERFRSGEPILMDYDFEDRKIFYSRQFVAKYGNNVATNTGGAEGAAEQAVEESSDENSGRDAAPSSDSTDDLKVMQEITALVFQELSRLMNIGRTQQTQNLATQFATNFMNHLLAETVLCEGQKDNSPFALALNPQTGMSFYIQDKTISDFKQPTNYQVTRSSGSTLTAWTLGSPFPFFDLQDQEASGAFEVVVNKLSPEIGVPLHSSYELIEIFQGVLTGTDHVIFWNFQEGFANQTYRMNYRPELASARASIEETGLINLNLQNLNEARLSIEVQKNNVLDEALNLQIPLTCEQVTSSFDLQSLLELNASQTARTAPEILNSQTSAEAIAPTSLQIAQPTVDRTETEIITSLFETRGCLDSDLAEDKKAECALMEELLIKLGDNN